MPRKKSKSPLKPAGVVHRAVRKPSLASILDRALKEEVVVTVSPLVSFIYYHDPSLHNSMVWRTKNVVGHPTSQAISYGVFIKKPDGKWYEF